jgi:hypothetical protein
MNEPYMLAIPSNFLICDLDAPAEFCEKCGEELEREFVNVHVRAKSVPAKHWKTIKVRQGHKPQCIPSQKKRRMNKE